MCERDETRTKQTLRQYSSFKKRNSRIGNETAARGAADPLAIKLQALDFEDLVHFEVAQIVSKVNNKQSPNSIQASLQTAKTVNVIEEELVYLKKK